MRVLVVDDSAPVRERLVEIISGIEGVEEVDQAWDVPTALAAAKEHSPDLVMLDLRMPGGGGVQLLGELPRRDSLPVVAVLTNFPYPQLRARCIELGADYFLDKSSDFNRIGEIAGSTRRRIAARRLADAGRRRRERVERSGD